jgi:hypothetical protein
MTSGKELVRQYQDSDTTSGNTLTRSFCTECGTSLFLSSPTKTDWISVCPAAVDGSEAWGGYGHITSNSVHRAYLSSTPRESPGRKVFLGDRPSYDTQRKGKAMIHPALLVCFYICMSPSFVGCWTVARFKCVKLRVVGLQHLRPL